MPDQTTNATPDVEEQRALVVERYSGLARQALARQTPTDSCGTGDTPSDCYGAAQYGPDEQTPQAALRASLGCGNPLAVADISPGEIVLDLGSGGGLDVILSARRTGPTGKAYGLDASLDMLTLARANAAEADVTNVEFLSGHIEDIPLPDGLVDVVISNCVINLSADKPRVIAEAFRVLRPGGRLGIADIVADDGLEAEHKATAERAANCANGTLTTGQYRHHLMAAGFATATITTTQQIAPGLHSAIIHATKHAA